MVSRCAIGTFEETLTISNKDNNKLKSWKDARKRLRCGFCHQKLHDPNRNFYLFIILKSLREPRSSNATISGVMHPRVIFNVRPIHVGCEIDGYCMSL